MGIDSVSPETAPAVTTARVTDTAQWVPSARERLSWPSVPMTGSGSVGPASLRVGDQGRQTRVPSGYADDVELWEAPVAASAYRHGYVDEDIRHAPRNLVAVAADPRDDDVTLLTAPTGRPT